MTRCTTCSTDNPAYARYCMHCGALLHIVDESPDSTPSLAGFTAFTWSMLASLAITAVLVFVFRLPIFFLAGFLPLLWWKKK